MSQEAPSDAEVDLSVPDDDEIDDTIQKRDEFASALIANGFAGVAVLSREGGREALSGRRPELLDYLAEHDPDSVREVARDLDRNKSNVSEDLTRLSRLGIVTYDDGPHGAKAPRLEHDHVVVEPIV